MGILHEAEIRNSLLSKQTLSGRQGVHTLAPSRGPNVKILGGRKNRCAVSSFWDQKRKEKAERHYENVQKVHCNRVGQSEARA